MARPRNLNGGRPRKIQGWGIATAEVELALELLKDEVSVLVASRELGKDWPSGMAAWALPRLVEAYKNGMIAVKGDTFTERAKKWSGCKREYSEENAKVLRDSIQELAAFRKAAAKPKWF
jgi:hypothetical protein